VDYIDADKMLRLDKAEKDAEQRYYAARDSGDVPASRVAARDWTAAAKAATDYALGRVEKYDDYR
jgi:hypothetical protein